MKQKQIPLILTASALLVLSSCGGGSQEASSSSTPQPSSSESQIVSSDESSSSSSQSGLAALQRALDKDYSNYTAYVGAIGSSSIFGSTSMEWYDYHVNGYDVIYDVSGAEASYTYFHDYENKSYQYFENGNSSAWLCSVYDGAPCGLTTSYWSLSTFLSSVSSADFTYVAGTYLFSNSTKFDTLIENAFPAFYEIELLDLTVSLDGNGYISKIKAYGTDPEKDLVDIDLTSFASTVAPSSVTLPNAPSASNVKEYWEYKGWSGPQIHVYPKTITLTPDAEALKNEEGQYVLEIEKTLAYKVEVEYDVPEGVEEARLIKESSITFHSSDESVAKVDVDENYNRAIKAYGEGTASIWAEGLSSDGKGSKSNVVEVKVNGLAEMDMTDAAYSITFDSTSSAGVSPSASNSLNSTLPFDIEVNKGVSVLSAPEGSLFAGSNTMKMVTGAQETINETFQGASTGGDAIASFDFSDQQVSSIGLYYGEIYSTAYYTDGVKITLQSKNEGQEWSEASVMDITSEIVSNISSDNLHLLQKSFSPASQVRIVLESNLIGKGMEFSFDKVVFASNEECAKHFVVDDVPVTSVTIASENDKTSVRLGKTLQFSAGVKPNNASSKEVVWSVSDEEIAAISSNGLLTPKKVGKVTVKASSYHGESKDAVVSNEIEIEVLEEAAVPTGALGAWIEEYYAGNTLISISEEEAKMTFGNGDEVTLPFNDLSEDGYAIFGAYVDKSTSGYLKVKTSSSYSNKLEYAYYVTGETSEHKANIYTSSSTLSKKADSMTLSCSQASLKVGDKTKGSATVSASFLFGKSSAYAEKWTLVSSDENIVALSFTDYDDNGDEITVEGKTSDNDSSAKKIIAKGEGTATLTATSEYGLTQSIEVTVEAQKKVSAISVSLSSSSVTVGSTLTASATVTPTDADNKEVTWSIENGTGEATITSKGVITAKKEGSVTVVATAKDGSGVRGEAILTITAASSDSIDGSYTCSSDSDDCRIDFDISNNGEKCAITVDDDAIVETAELTLSSSSGSVYTYEGSINDTMYGGDMEIRIEFDADNMTLTLFADDNSDFIGCNYSTFTMVAVTKA